MPLTLLHNATTLVTMDAQRREIADGALTFDGQEILWVGRSEDLPLHLAAEVTQRIDARGKLVLPGFVNTHHHFYQTLTRVIPAAQDAVLFDWLKILYPIWAELTPGDVQISTQLALTELLLSGCTTSSDHHYLWPNGSRLDDQFEAAERVGVRFHGARGSMSLGESAGGLPPDRVTEPEAAILQDCRRVVESFHNPRRFAMRRVVIAPCSPFSVTPELMRESAALARSFGPGMNVHLHTHLAETADEEAFCLEKFGYRPGDYAQELGWTGDDVWHAHCVHLNQPEIENFAATRTGVAHCPTSNMRLASGIAPVRAMRDAGVAVGLGVDGSASNDGSHLLAEVRQCLLLQRLGLSLSKPLGNPKAMTAREALEIATLGGAAILGRDDIGSLAPGMAADIIAFDLNALTYAGGAVHDPVAALVFCQPQPVDLAIINGRLLVKEGVPLNIDLPTLTDNHNRAARALLVRAGRI
ncbi:MAG: 8-oxoguanine deaminase [Caldilineaceae bacterium]|nr:8-oxoguanine deaminase [Caldilineaceae bacterium]HRJ44517.1 8-oxoguanine deaminase [Caldilineaceae bacterium]